MKLNSLSRIGLSAVAATLLTVGCDSGDPTGPNPNPNPNPNQTTPTTASGWIDFVDWNQATVVEVDMVEAGAVLSFAPADVTFEAGKPYILRIKNAPVNAGKHYYSPEGTSFFQAVATRKVQTADAEYKAPYFDAVELLIGGTLEFYIVPVLAGTYDIYCSILGHKAAGMFGTATITGGAGYQLDLEVAPDFNAALTTDGRKSGSDPVWTSATDVNVGMLETATTYEFAPPDLTLTKDAGFKLLLDNPAGNTSKHYYTAAEFYKTLVLRKAEDSQAEIKAPYLKAVELLMGGTSTLFIVPTVTGAFNVICTIAGHEALGMTGTITVDP